MVDVSKCIVSAASDFARMNVLLDRHQIRNDYFDFARAHEHSMNCETIQDLLKIVSSHHDVVLDPFQSHVRRFMQCVALVGEKLLVEVNSNMIAVLDVVSRKVKLKTTGSFGILQEGVSKR